MESIATTTQKICRHCNQPKPREAYWVDRKKKDGLYFECIECYNGLKKRKIALAKRGYRTGLQVDPERIFFEGIVPRIPNTRIPEGKEKAILDDIMEVIQVFFGVTLTDISQERRDAMYVFPRNSFYWFISFYKELSVYDPFPFNPSNSYVSEIVGRGHCTFNHGVKTMNNMLETDKDFRKIFESLKREMDVKISKYNLGV